MVDEQWQLARQGEARRRIGGFLSEEYAVRQHWIRRSLTIFQIDAKNVRDCFSTSSNRRFPKNYTRQEDALWQDWDIAEVMWCNPPWTIWPEVTQKVLQSGCQCICVLPAWHSKGWVKDLLMAAWKTIYLEVGTKVFELGSKPVGGIK